MGLAMLMRFFLFCTALLMVSPCFAQEPAQPQPQPLPQEQVQLPVQQLVAPPQTVAVAPHTATYKMTLGKAKAGSGVSNVTGTMIFDWQDVCDGWAIQQNMQLSFLYTEGEESSVSSPAVTWESKDGKAFNFHVKRLVGEQEDEAFKGRAKRDEKGAGLAHYTTPLEKRDIEFTSDVVFPSAHTLMIMQKAAAGEKMFTQRVFDGADAEGLVDISAFIGPRLDALDDTALAPEVRGNALLTQQAWPIRLAFYKPQGAGSEPDYEMDFVLQSNGIARSITIDYGDFTITGTLVKLESQPALSCAEGQKIP
ncbi:MAG TPA: DUF1849 domain-containing protein [Rhodospirillaceae bacterium]|nr:DUF1849 domain-containing protein [Rhodospirillaceae bacterium]